MKLDSGIRIETCPGVYPPSEDSHLMLSAIEAVPGQRVLEMGTGSGIIALHCARAGCRVTAADISSEAIDCAYVNSIVNHLDLELVQSDLFGSIIGKFDVIIFNPPYLSSTDSGALTEAERRPLVGGEKGHEVSMAFLEEALDFLRPGGKIYLLTSSESRARILEKASQDFTVRTVAERRIFFEVLAVLELRMGNH